MPTRLATDSESAAPILTHVKVGIIGCTGRVGKLLVQELLSGHWEGLSLAGGTVRDGIPVPENSEFHISHDADDLFVRSDVVIDFTNPEATAKHVWLAAKHHKPLVIGTTGLSAVQEQELKDASKECAIVYAANMSVGVNLLLALVEDAAKRLGPEWDIEINETHHKHKIDAPSGTALALGKAAQAGRGTGDFVTERQGERTKGTIGFSVQRGGDVVGEHTVSFFGEGERIELSHRATNRALFARGALHASYWVKDQAYGLYGMREVLGL